MLSRGKSVIVVRSVTPYDDKNERPYGRYEQPSGPVVGVTLNVPTPLQLEKFIPWVCSQWSASTSAQITNKPQEKYIKLDIKKISQRLGQHTYPVPRKLKPKSIASQSSTAAAAISFNKLSSSEAAFGRNLFSDKVIPIIAYHDYKNNLVEIAVVGCHIKASRKVIHALSLCTPHHAALTRFTYSKSRLTDVLIYEISKLLPLSNITEICLDDSRVRQQNYYILLEQAQLKFLSLNRCGINDESCKKIFMNLDLGGASEQTLQILELGLNDITDEGAKFIGKVLRINRCLLHLNISGNKLTDDGFKAIMNSLKEFPLTYEENMAMKKRKLIYLKNKSAVNVRYLKDLRNGRSDVMDATTSSTSAKKSMLQRSLNGKSKIADESLFDHAEMMARVIVGDFVDHYGPENVVTKNGILYSKGNMVLCSLNVAYNNLEFASILKLYEVLNYQHEMDKLSKETGLMRVTLDGNYMPSSCYELEFIDAYLRQKIDSRLSAALRKTTTSSLLSKLSVKQQSQQQQ